MSKITETWLLAAPHLPERPRRRQMQRQKISQYYVSAYGAKRLLLSGVRKKPKSKPRTHQRMMIGTMRLDLGINPGHEWVMLAQVITWGALTAAASTPEKGQRARDFFTWVKTQWDEPGDNIFVWDFFELETEGGLYLKLEYAVNGGDSHPNASFCQAVALYFGQRLVNVIEGRGDTTRLDGKPETTSAAPTITSQPQSTTVTAGQTATFSVIATGIPTPTFQWRKGGSAIADAISSSYTTPVTTASDNGAVYSVSVSNSAGSVISNNATLTVATTNPGQINSLEFGHTGFPVKDYCNPFTLSSDFGNGALFSIWTRIPVPLVAAPGFPSYRGNMIVFYFYGDNWGLTCLVGNAGVNSNGLAIYNANFMLDPGNNTWGGDYCTYQTFEADRMPVADVNGWVWVAWQVVINSDHSMTLRQWLKFGMEGTVFPAGNFRIVNGNWEPLPIPGEETVIRTGWFPSNPKSFRIGDDNTYSGENTGSNSYLCHARMEARTSKPSVQELEAIARRNTPDPSAWGD